MVASLTGKYWRTERRPYWVVFGLGIRMENYSFEAPANHLLPPPLYHCFNLIPSPALQFTCVGFSVLTQWTEPASANPLPWEPGLAGGDKPSPLSYCSTRFTVTSALPLWLEAGNYCLPRHCVERNFQLEFCTARNANYIPPAASFLNICAVCGWQ